jgi:hypothetical protein
MDRRSPAPSCGDLRQADETKAHHAGFVIGASISAYCPDQAPPRSVNVRATASRPRRSRADAECSLSSNEARTFAAAGGCHPLGVRWPGRGDANLSRRPSGRAGGCGAFSDTKLDVTVLDADFRTQKLPTNLAHLSVKGARPLAIAQVVSVYGVMAQGFVAASLVGSGIGDADTGIVGVCLCWWNAEGCQCYGRCRRCAH